VQREKDAARVAKQLVRTVQVSNRVEAVLKALLRLYQGPIQALVSITQQLVRTVQYEASC
jgi:hypothetical protein